jgi:hypothetical protein
MTKIAEGITTTYALESIENRAPERKTNEASRIRETEERNDFTSARCVLLGIGRSSMHLA